MGKQQADELTADPAATPFLDQCPPGERHEMVRLFRVEPKDPPPKACCDKPAGTWQRGPEPE